MKSCEDSESQFYMTNSDNSLASPCVDICAINSDKICVGCHRSLDEIAAWGGSSDRQKLAILIAAKERRESDATAN
jgi:predicted Fe-S protein YdhL (DUF1289 family)